MVSPALKGVFQSLRTYYDGPERASRMDALYGRFLRPGDLAFDVGSHVGDRVASFRRLGANVVALEPQPLPFRAIEIIYGRDDKVTVLPMACGPEPGSVQLHVNEANPTVSTASDDFIQSADGAGGWEGQVWTKQISVDMTTLDRLIIDYGIPRFVKVDVEGFELDVLRGLSHPVDVLSFEFTTIQRDVARRCLGYLSTLGDYRFNISLGESHEMTFQAPLDETSMAKHINGLPHEANSGDVYAIKD